MHVGSRTAPPRSPYEPCVRALQPPGAPLSAGPTFPRSPSPPGSARWRHPPACQTGSCLWFRLLCPLLSRSSLQSSSWSPVPSRITIPAYRDPERHGHFPGAPQPVRDEDTLASRLPAAPWLPRTCRSGPPAPPSSPAGRPLPRPPAWAASHAQKSHPSYLPWTHLSWLIFNNVEISL